MIRSRFNHSTPILVFSLFVIFGLLSPVLLQAQAATPVPPKAPRHPHPILLHDRFWNDPYFWLRNATSSEVIRHLEAENAYLDAVMKPEEALRERLFKEMVARIKETDLSVPMPFRGYLYYSRTEKGKQYKIHCRKKGNMDAPEEILVDGNAFAREKPFFDIGDIETSPDQRLVAFSTDYSGSESFTFFVKDMATGRILSDSVGGAYYGCTWTNDNKAFFYTTFDSAQRPFRVFKHVLGAASGTDPLVFEEKDERFEVSISKSRSDRFIFIQSQSNTCSEVRIIDADSPDTAPRLFARRRENVEYHIEHHDDRFFIVTNDSARNFRICVTPVSATEAENWKDFIPHDINVKIDDIEMFEKFAVVIERRKGLKTMRAWDFEKRAFRDLPLPEPTYEFWPDKNPEFSTTKFRFFYHSLVTPKSVYDQHLDSGKLELLKQFEVLGGYDPRNYRCERIEATASDGTKVPISIVFRKDWKRNGKQPLYLTGYGAYGTCYDPDFASYRLSLLDRGFAFAIAHIRGGGELGRPWYESGKMLKKKNTFTDFIACAEHLVSQGYTSPERLAISGMSAGGLLMGAVTTMRPDLFKAVVAEVPFVDVINTMLDESIPLTVTEWEEWGNPRKPDQFAYMASYSPYDNTTPREYPNLLVTGGLNDTRVKYWEPAKWVARLREVKTDRNLLVLKMNMAAGHGGASGRYDYLKDVALEYAFLFKVLGIE